MPVTNRMAEIAKSLRELTASYVANLVVVVGYLRKLLDNARIVRYPSQNFPELLTEFQKLVETRALKE